MEVILTYPTSQGSRQFVMSGDSLTIGRGAVDLQIDDESMSRHHATIYREGEKVWILDENSTNGTFVNGAEVSPNGTPLRDGDAIRIGNETTFALGLQKETPPKAVVADNSAGKKSVSGKTSKSSISNQAPLLIIAVSVLIIGLVGVGIGAALFLQPKPSPTDANTEIVENKSNAVNPKTDDPDEPGRIKRGNRKSEPSPTPNTTGGNNDNSTNPPISTEPTTSTPLVIPSGKTYLQMSPDEQQNVIKSEAQKIARTIGNREGDAITSEAVSEIKLFLDGYAKRINNRKSDGGCRFGADLQTLLERASKNAPFINRAFGQQNLPSQIGLYLAMIESEHCVCLQSPTGPLGMFQFTFATAKNFFDPNTGVIKGAKPPVGDDRCKPEPAAHASAKYMDFLVARYGTGPDSVPLAIASYNSGEGGLDRNLEAGLKTAKNKERNFWTLLLEADKLSDQFRKENRKYVPKFFAAAIIGENPPLFGVSLPPLSSFTK